MTEVLSIVGGAPKHIAWNKGKNVGAKPALRPKHVWSITDMAWSSLPDQVGVTCEWGGQRASEAARNGSDEMRAQQINGVSGKVLMVLSLMALLAVLSGYTQPPQPDEGTAAHIFQLSIVALAPMIVLFLATADWGQPLRSVARPLAIPVATLALAFAALHYLEQYR